MFVAVHSVNRNVLSRLEYWANRAWPDGNYFEALGWSVWSDGKSGQDPIVLPDAIVVVDGLIWCHGTLWGPRLASQLLQDVEAGWPLGPGWDGSFGFAILRTREALVGLDAAGLRRLYTTESPSEEAMSVASLQLPCAIASGGAPDLVGVAEMLSLGRTIGRRTLFTECSEVWPGEAMRISVGRQPNSLGFDRAVEPREHGVAYSHAEAAEMIAPLLRTGAARAFDSASSVGIALSGGVDSRLALAALLPDRTPHVAVSYGDPADADVRLAAEVAHRVGIPHHVVDLRGRLFPDRTSASVDALRCEATWNPVWISMNSALDHLGCGLLILGDVTDSLQVRVEGLWNRRQRVVRQVRHIVMPWTVERLPEFYETVESWWAHHRERVTERVSKGANQFHIPIEAAALRRGLERDLEVAWLCGGLGRFHSALDAEDAFQVSIARQQAGSQVNAVGGGAVGHSAFATRNAVKAARSLGLDLRQDRMLLLELSKVMFPPSLRRLATATIPVVPATSPMVLQNAVWMARFSLDWSLRRVNRVVRARLPRERVIKALELPAEYRAAGPECFLAGSWTNSGTFLADPLSSAYRRMLEGQEIPMIPITQYVALRTDTLLTALTAGGDA